MDNAILKTKEYNFDITLKDKDFLGALSTLFPDLVYFYDYESQKNIYFSQNIHKILGYSKEDVIDSANQFFYKALIHPEDQSNTLTELNKLNFLEDGEVLEFKHRLRKKDGEYLWFYQRELVLRRNLLGKPKIIFGVAQDITKMLAKNKLLSDIAWISSHNLRGPVSTILGLVGLMEEEEMDAHNRKLLNYIGETAQKLDDIIHVIVEKSDMQDE